MKTRFLTRSSAAALAATVFFGAANCAAAWTAGPPLNIPRGFSGTTIDACGNIWVTGGLTRPTQILSTIEVLTFDGSNYATTWTLTSTSLPTPRTAHGAIVVGSYLYIIGGHADWSGQALNTVDRYDMIGGTWDTAPAMNLGRAGFGSPVVDRFGRIWVVGGSTGHGLPNTASTEFYDPSRPALGWQEGPTLNTPRGDAGVVVDLKGRIVAIGGIGNPGVHVSTVEQLDPCGGIWQTQLSSLPVPVSNNRAAVALGADEFIYTVGVWLPGYSSACLRLDCKNDPSVWESFDSIANARNAASLVRGNDSRLYVIGGECCDTTSIASVEVLNTKRCLGDFNRDGVVDLSDLTLMLSAFGSICP